MSDLHRRLGPAVLALALISTLAFAAATNALAASAGPDSVLVQGDPIRGKSLYQACSGCHSLDENDVGPKHRGVVGRHSAIVPGYAYSPALKASGLTWDRANLDRWLTNPQALVPGARMYFSVRDAQTRADIIAYLAQQH